MLFSLACPRPGHWAGFFDLSPTRHMVGSSQAGSGIGNKFSQCLACFLSGQKFLPEPGPHINRIRLGRVFFGKSGRVYWQGWAQDLGGEYSKFQVV